MVMGHSTTAWSIVSGIIGWVYFLAWSVSFYPQAILNWRRSSVQGLSIDFLYYNVMGFLCYSVFNCVFFFSEEVREEYRHRNNDNDNLVRANDVLFAVHALLISSFTLSQSFIYKRDATQALSGAAKAFLVLCFVSIFAYMFGITTGHFMWIDLMYFMSYIKLLISFIKYIPQALLNFERKSTVGWSIHNILLDFTGGILSIFQLLMDASISGDWSGVTGDPVKFGLGFIAVAFDVLFMAQHYIIYPSRGDDYIETDEERQRLLDEETR